MQPGDRIKDFRKNKGLSQKAFAEKMDYSFAYVSDIERGKTKPSRDFLEKLNEVFGISSDYILYSGTAADLDQVVTDLKSAGLDYELIEKIRLRCLEAIYRGGREEWQRGERHGLAVREPGAEYQALPTSTKKLIKNVEEILESGNDVMIDALKHNIKAFLEAIRVIKNQNEDKGRG